MARAKDGDERLEVVLWWFDGNRFDGSRRSGDAVGDKYVDDQHIDDIESRLTAAVDGAVLAPARRRLLPRFGRAR